MPKILKRLSAISWRDLLFVGLPSLLALGLGFWAAAQYIRPAMPHQLIMTTGAEGGAYDRYAALYKDVLADYGVELIVRPSAGADENLQRLRDENSDVDIGFVQAGMDRVNEDDDLVSLGNVCYEPLWIFYRQGLVGKVAKDAALTSVSQLRGARISIGKPGSGTYRLAREVLQANGIADAPTTLLERGGMDAVEALQQGKIDAVFVVGPTESAVVWALLYSDGIKLMSLAEADAYVRRFPYLEKLTLPRGAVDLARNMPAQDVTLVAPVAMLLAHDETHPALIDLVLQAAAQVHGGAGIFQKPGEFPQPTRVDFPLSTEAERYYKSGKPFLERYLPFWAATLIDRLAVMLLPTIALLLPILRYAPSLYTWRVRSRIYRHYGELKFVESEVEAYPERHSRAEWLQRLDEIEKAVNHISTPLSHADMLYTLRDHIGLVRAVIMRKTRGDVEPKPV